MPKAFSSPRKHSISYMLQPVTQTGKYFVANALVTPRNNGVPCEILNNTNYDIVLTQRYTYCSTHPGGRPRSLALGEARSTFTRRVHNIRRTRSGTELVDTYNKVHRLTSYHR